MLKKLNETDFMCGNVLVKTTDLVKKVQQNVFRHHGHQASQHVLLVRSALWEFDFEPTDEIVDERIEKRVLENLAILEQLEAEVVSGLSQKEQWERLVALGNSSGWWQ